MAHSALFAGYYTYLSSNVIVNRLNTNIYLGSSDSDKVSGPGGQKANSPADLAKLQRAVRAHGNFTESAPFAFFLIFLAELNGAPTSLVHAAYTTLFAARVAHASIGIQAENSAAIGRPIGALVTLAVTLSAGLYNVSHLSLTDAKSVVTQLTSVCLSSKTTVEPRLGAPQVLPRLQVRDHKRTWLTSMILDRSTQSQCSVKLCGSNQSQISIHCKHTRTACHFSPATAGEASDFDDWRA